jgi:hypothetical protein
VVAAGQKAAEQDQLTRPVPIMVAWRIARSACSTIVIENHDLLDVRQHEGLELLVFGMWQVAIARRRIFERHHEPMRQSVGQSFGTVVCSDAEVCNTGNDLGETAQIVRSALHEVSARSRFKAKQRDVLDRHRQQ